MQGINGSEGGYGISLNIRAANAGEAGNIDLWETPGLVVNGKDANGVANRGQYQVFGVDVAKTSIELNVYGNGYSATTAVHELGHAIGFSHAQNATQSFMSYSCPRNSGPTFSEYRRIVEAYR